MVHRKKTSIELHGCIYFFENHDCSEVANSCSVTYSIGTYVVFFKMCVRKNDLYIKLTLLSIRIAISIKSSLCVYIICFIISKRCYLTLYTYIQIKM